MTRSPDTRDATTTTQVESVEVIRLGKDEMNLAEFPIALLSDRVPKGKKLIQYRDTVFDEKTGKHVNRTLTISADEAHGLPTAVDDDVILGLIQLTKMVNNFKSRDVEFSRLDLIKLLGWPDSGDSYRRLATSLKRWLSVTLLYDNAWRDNRNGDWVTKGFHILDNIELNNSRGHSVQGELFPSKITWNKVVFESFEAGYLKSIDYGLYLRLRHAIAKRMYRFLSKRMYFGPDLTFDLYDLAFAHIGISDTYRGNAGKIKEKLQPAIDELVNVGFLEPMDKTDRYTKRGKDWDIRLIQKAPCPLPSSTSATPEGSVPQLVAALAARDVTKAAAEILVQQYPEENIRAKIEAFDWLLEQREKRIAKNPAGYLVKSIKEDYAAPKGFVPKAERDRRQREKEARERKAIDEQLRVRLEKAREDDQRRKHDDYWASLTPKEQDELQARADAEAGSEAFANATTPLRKLGQAISRNAYIERLLASRGTESA